MRKSWTRSVAVAALALSIAVVASGGATPANAQFSRLRGMLPNGTFSVDGRKGPLLTTLDPARITGRIAAEDASGMAIEGSNVASYEGMGLEMPETVALINELTTRIYGPWPYATPSTIAFHMVADPRYSAEAKPDGSIMVRMGLLTQAGSDDEVALMLAHEMGHVRLGHFADDGGFRNKRRVATAIGQIYATGITLSEMQVVQRGDNIEFTIDDVHKVEEERRRAAKSNAMLRELMTLFFERTWARNQEDEADALAFDLLIANDMAATGAAEAMFGRIEADYEWKAESSRALLAQLDYTQKLVVTEDNATQAMNGNFGGIWRTVSGPLQSTARNRLLGVARGFFDQRHRTPEARSNGLRVYSDNAHPTASMGTFNEEWLGRVRGTGEYADAVMVIDALRESGVKEAAGDIPGALAAMAPTRATRYRAAPVVANNAARLNGLAGNITEADRLYTAAHASKDQSQAAYIAHAQLMVDSRRYARALEVVNLGKAAAPKDIDSEKGYLPVLIAMNYRQNKDAEGLVYLQRCLRYEEDAFRTACVGAALDIRDNGKPPTPEQQARIEAVRRDAEAQLAVGATDIDGLMRSVGSIFGGG